MVMKLYRQTDPRWADYNIGRSLCKIGDYGCTLSCIAMLATWYGNPSITPLSVANEDWYTIDGLIIWNKISLPKMAFVRRVRSYNLADATRATNGNDTSVILEVFTGKYKHWVVGCYYSRYRGWRIADPLTGSYRWMPRNWKPIGMAFFTRYK